jgi:hypothetical protein
MFRGCIGARGEPPGPVETVLGIAIGRGCRISAGESLAVVVSLSESVTVLVSLKLPPPSEPISVRVDVVEVTRCRLRHVAPDDGDANVEIQKLNEAEIVTRSSISS